MTQLVISSKEQTLIEMVRRVGKSVPYGEVVFIFHFQDGVPVLISMEHKKETVKL